MKIKGAVLEYLRLYWGINRFMKTVSMVVLICFVWNIVGPNLAYAQQTSLENTDLNKHQQDNVNVGTLSVKDAFGTNGYTKDKDNVIKKEGKLWGIWDEDKQAAMQATPNGFKANKAVTEIIRQQDTKKEEKAGEKQDTNAEGKKEEKGEEKAEEKAEEAETEVSSEKLQVEIKKIEVPVAQVQDTTVADAGVIGGKKEQEGEQSVETGVMGEENKVGEEKAVDLQANRGENIASTRDRVEVVDRKSVV
jgi:hypothetical protein